MQALHKMVYGYKHALCNQHFSLICPLHSEAASQHLTLPACWPPMRNMSTREELMQAGRAVTRLPGAAGSVMGATVVRTGSSLTHVCWRCYVS